MSEQQRKSPRRLLPFLPALRLPALPLPVHVPRLARPAKKRSNFASATVAITDSVVLGAAAPAAPAAPPCKVPIKPASDVLAGALARAASQSTIHPLDTLKVRLQTKGRVPVSAGGAGVSKFGQLVPPPGGFDLKAAGKSVASLYKVRGPGRAAACSCHARMPLPLLAVPSHVVNAARLQ